MDNHDCNKDVCRSKQCCMRGGSRRPSATTDSSKFVVPSNIANSTQILFVEPNFTETPSEYDVFYDCLSDHDMPMEGSSPKADYKPKPSATPINECNMMDKSSMTCGLSDMPVKSDVLTVNIERTPVDTTNGGEFLNVNYLPQAPLYSKSVKCKKCNLLKSDGNSADILAKMPERAKSGGGGGGGKCKKCNKPKSEVRQADCSPIMDFNAPTPNTSKSSAPCKCHAPKCDVPKPDNASNLDLDVCKVDYASKAGDVSNIDMLPKTPDVSKTSSKCKKCNSENFISKMETPAKVDCMSNANLPEPAKTCPRCKVCNVPNISGPPKAPEPIPAESTCAMGDVSVSCTLPNGGDVPKEGSVTKCMPNIVGCLSDCRDFRVALQHMVATTTKLLTDFDLACRREKRCQKRRAQPRTVQLEVTAKLAPTCNNSPPCVMIEPFSFTIPLRLQMNNTPPCSKMSLDVSASVQGSCCKSSMEPIRTATISAMNRSCQITTSEQDSVPIMKQASCCTVTMVQSAQMICMQKTVKETFQTEEPLEKTFEDFQSLVPECTCLAAAPEPPKPVYHQALPQHRCLDTCTPCRYSPSPLIDEEGRVFCPYNCGCCLCPWKRRATDSLEERLKHQKIKVCKCRERGTIFTEFDKRDPKCSVTSYFDVCPCREKAEATFLELYGTEMWTVDERLQENVRGDEVKLEEVREITQPNEPRCWPSLTHG